MDSLVNFFAYFLSTDLNKVASLVIIILLLASFFGSKANANIFWSKIATKAKAWGGGGDTSVISHLSKLRTTTTDKFNKLTQKFKTFCAKNGGRYDRQDGNVDKWNKWQAFNLQRVDKVNSVLAQDFNSIDDYYQELNKDVSHFHNSNDICTPMGCVKEMVDTIPASFWRKKNIKVLDSCCGNGNFHAYIQKKTSVDNLYFNEVNQERINNVKDIFGDAINITTRDFLSFPDDEVYDLVVSNPPYAKFNGEKRISKNHNLSRDFILKAITITKPNGYILFITPNNWMSYADRNILPKLMSRYQFLHLNIHGAKKWFPRIGSSFTWFLLRKSPNLKAFTVENNYIRKDTKTARLDKEVDFIPLYYSNEVQAIFNKTVRADLPKYNVETTSYLHRFTHKYLISDAEDMEFPYRLIHTPNQTVWSKKSHKYQDGWKVFISLTDKYRTFIDNCGMTQSIMFIRCKSFREAKKIKNELDKPVYKFLNNLTRYGNFNNIRVLQSFPIWSGINLTDKETEYIDKFVGE